MKIQITFTELELSCIARALRDQLNDLKEYNDARKNAVCHPLSKVLKAQSKKINCEFCLKTHGEWEACYTTPEKGNE